LGGRKGMRPVKKLSGGVLAWLCIWSKVQICIWPSWCRCHSLSLAPVNPDSFYLSGFTFLVPVHPGGPGQNPEGCKTVIVVVVVVYIFMVLGLGSNLWGLAFVDAAGLEVLLVFLQGTVITQTIVVVIISMPICCKLTKQQLYRYYRYQHFPWLYPCLW